MPLILALLLTACASGSTHDLKLSNSFAPTYGYNSADKFGKPKRPASDNTAANPGGSVAGNNPSGRNPEPLALDEFLQRMQAERRNPGQHGIYVEELSSGQAIAALNESAMFNPASVIKLATTLAALEKFGPSHRFRTEFRFTGEINSRTGELNGDLILVSGGDPSFSIQDARQAGDALRRFGISRISGSLVVVGDFICNENSQTDISAGVFRRQSRLVFRGQTRFENRQANYDHAPTVLVVESDSLLNIARYLNAHSVNAMADMLADHVGGAAGVQRFLVERVGVPGHLVYVSHGSGLEVNRLTPVDTVRILRAMIDRLYSNGLRIESVMPVAGIDSGTLAGRFSEPQFAGSVIAKTGTLHSTDDGVAALAGAMNTRSCGVLLFAVYNMAEGRRVLHLRRVQDDFLKRLMTECGGAMPLANRQESEIAFRPQSRLLAAR